MRVVLSYKWRVVLVDNSTCLVCMYKWQWRWLSDASLVLLNWESNAMWATDGSFLYLLASLTNKSFWTRSQSSHGVKIEILFYYWLGIRASRAKNRAREQKAVLETESCAETANKKERVEGDSPIKQNKEKSEMAKILEVLTATHGVAYLRR